MNKVLLLISVILTTSCSLKPTDSSEVSSRGPAQITDIGKALNQAKEELRQVQLKSSPQLVSQAYIKLIDLQLRARDEGHTCDFEDAYLYQVVSNVQKAVSIDPLLQKNFKQMKAYQKLSHQSLTMQLMAEAFLQGLALDLPILAQRMNTIVKNSSFTLYKTQQGAYPMGQLDIRKSFVKESFFDLDQMKLNYGGARPVSIVLKNGRTVLMINQKPAYDISFMREGKEIRQKIKSTDDIFIRKINSDRSLSQDPTENLNVLPDECSA